MIYLLILSYNPICTKILKSHQHEYKHGRSRLLLLNRLPVKTLYSLIYYTRNPKYVHIETTLLSGDLTMAVDGLKAPDLSLASGYLDPKKFAADILQFWKDSDFTVAKLSHEILESSEAS